MGETVWVSLFFDVAALPETPEVREPGKIVEIGWFALDAVAHETVPYVRAALVSNAPYLELDEDPADAFAPQGPGAEARRCRPQT